MEEKKDVLEVSFLAFEASQSRMERINRRMFILILALIIALVDMNAYGAFIKGGLDTIPLIINIASTVIMTISVIATVFSGWDYVKNGKDLLLEK